MRAASFFLSKMPTWVPQVVDAYRRQFGEREVPGKDPVRVVGVEWVASYDTVGRPLAPEQFTRFFAVMEGET